MLDILKTADGVAALPEVILAIAAMALLMVGVYRSKPSVDFVTSLSLLVLAGTAALVMFSSSGTVEAFHGAFVVDKLSGVLKMWVVAIIAMALIYSTSYLRDRSMLKGEFYVLSLFGVLGMMIMISSGGMLTAYLGLEMLFGQFLAFL